MSNSQSPPSSNPPVGLIGIGLLGSAIAERLLSAGVSVVGHDLDDARLEAFRALGGTAASGAPEVFARCSRVLLSLPSHTEVSQLLVSNAASLRAGLTLIDTTTGAPANTETLGAELAARDVIYLDATISGSSAQVRNGSAVAMVGGDPAGFAACQDVFGMIAQEAFHTGPSGTGAKMKLVTNLVLGLNRAALAEGLALATGLGLDATQALAIMRAGPAYARIMDRKGEKMLSGDFTPEARLSQHLKDVKMIVELGEQAGLPMTLSTAHRAILEEAEAAGLGALDNCALIQVLRGLTAKSSRP